MPSTIIQEGFQDTEDLGGLFSGFDPETGDYDASEGHWGYEGSRERPQAAQDGQHRSGEVREGRARGFTATASMGGAAHALRRARR